MTSHSFQIDPYAILGIGSEASLQEIREAYHRRSKKYHPDLGGEEWVFKILYQAYEIVSQARVARAAQLTAARGTGASRVSPTSAAAPPGAGEMIRKGLQDKVDDPNLIVAVEILWIRFETENVWLFQPGARQDDRSLSCSLSVTWPDATTLEAAGTELSEADAARIAPGLEKALAQTRSATHAVSVQSHIEDGRLSAWLSYPTVDQAWAAFRTLREALRWHGLGVRQWSRDIIIPRGWR